MNILKHGAKPGLYLEKPAVRAGDSGVLVGNDDSKIRAHLLIFHFQLLHANY